MKKADPNKNYVHYLYLFLLGIICIGVYYYCFDTKIFIGGDNIYYYNLGKALAEGKGYVTLNHPQIPLASHYPPGYPVIISFVLFFISKSIIAVKITNGFFLLGSAVINFLIFKKLCSNTHLAFVSTLLLILNPAILESSFIMMSEIPFLFFTMLTFLFYFCLENDISVHKQANFYGFILCLLVSYYIKTMGIALILGFIVYFLTKNKWKSLVLTSSLALIFILPWTLRNQFLGGGSYLKQLFMVNPYRPELGEVGIGDLVSRFAINLERYLTTEIPAGLFPFLKIDILSIDLLAWITGIVICLTILYGIYQLKNYSLLILSYLMCLFGILLFWPEVWHGTRFIVPILPLLIFCYLLGLNSLLSYLLQKVSFPIQWHSLYLLTFIIFFIPAIFGVHLNAKLPYTQNWREYIAIAEWTKNNTNKNAIISCRKPAIFNLFSDRKTFRFKDTPDHKILIQDLKNHSTDYVVVEQLGFSSTLRYLKPTVEEYKQHFGTVFEASPEKSYLLKFKSEF